MQRFGGTSTPDLKIRDAEGVGVVGDRLKTCRVRFKGDRSATRMGAHPLDADGPTTSTDIPQQGTGVGREGSKGERSDFGFGELAVVLVRKVGEAGAAVGEGASWVRWAVERKGVKLGAVGFGPLVGALGKLVFGGTV